MENLNFLNGKQYPFGYKYWIWQVCVGLNLNDKHINTAYKQIDIDAYLPYFMEGKSPSETIREDLSHEQ
ncbi:hypothetical protein [Chryseobacterium carnipullorum]|uniref:Uncharacterized protein n=1 Tax=Chryseobacterium carnipullorum TaxID=1124835 RepID=A0A376DU11_CHRCU|nr:hypothetical protein [Chryseobacterium carnipullorum]AZA64656.1 hypothetical protein EG345_07985 [Chryseobacterium carnipullorum]STC95638.1 Uncharacterised protein [Chryseobacterium carnipullorum]